MHAGKTNEGVEVSVDLQAPAALPTVYWYSSSGPQSRSGYFGEETKSLEDSKLSGMLRRVGL